MHFLTLTTSQIVTHAPAHWLCVYWYYTLIYPIPLLGGPAWSRLILAVGYSDHSYYLQSYMLEFNDRSRETGLKVWTRSLQTIAAVVWRLNETQEQCRSRLASSELFFLQKIALNFYPLNQLKQRSGRHRAGGEPPKQEGKPPRVSGPDHGRGNQVRSRPCWGRKNPSESASSS
jgi:hypothetical protein